jgi:hypothetical protein
MQLLGAPIYYRVGIKKPLGTFAQEIDLLQTIVLNTPIGFPVALLMNDMSDVLELLAHSSTPTHLQQQEDSVRGEHNIRLVYLRSYGGQLPLDSSFVDRQATMLAYQSLDLSLNMPQRLRSRPGGHLLSHDAVFLSSRTGCYAVLILATSSNSNVLIACSRSTNFCTWLHTHNRRVKQIGKGVRVLSCLLPTKSPWLNPIEAKWVHGKQAVVEAERLLSASELESRVYADFGCSLQDHLVLPEKAA